MSSMNKVKVSSKFQLVIPLSVRRVSNVYPGEEFQVLPYEDRIELIPVRKVKKMRGFLKGIDTTVERERDRV